MLGRSRSGIAGTQRVRGLRELVIYKWVAISGISRMSPIGAGVFKLIRHGEAHNFSVI